MNFLRYSLRVSGVLAVVMIITPSNAYAYIDPGTGSYILQIVLATLLGALFALKMFWKNVKDFLTGLLPGRQKPKHDE